MITRMAVVRALCLWTVLFANAQATPQRQQVASPAVTSIEQDAINKMRGHYEAFFTARYSLEQEFPFRLVSIRGELAPYQPDTNILASMVEFGMEKRLRGIDAQEIKGTLLNALSPILYALTTSGSGSIDLFSIASQVSGKAFKDLLSIRSDIQEVLKKYGKDRVVYRLYLAPYRKTDARLVYNEQKIDMVRYGRVSLFDDQLAKAEDSIAKEIDLQRAHLYYHYDGKKTAPSFLGAGMHFSFSEDQAMLNCEILAHLYPRSFPYEETVDDITFRKVVIPTGDDFRHPVVLLKIQVPIYQTDADAIKPTLTVDFGNFSGIKDYKFIVSEQKSDKFTPYLLGSVSKFKALDVKFQFKTILLSLQSLQAESVKMVFRPIFKIGSLVQADLGGYTLKKVDEEFKTSINASLAEAKDKAIDKINFTVKETVKEEVEKEMRTTIVETAKNKEVSNLLRDGVMYGLEKILAKAEDKLSNAN